MAFPTVESVTETAFATASSSHVIDLPATVTDGDLLLLLYSNHEALTTGTPPSGWTELWNSNDPPTDNGVGAGFARVGVSGDSGGTVTINTSSDADGATAQVYRITGWEGTIGSGVEAGTFTRAVDSSPDPPSLSPAWGSADTLWIAVASYYDDDPAVSSFPTGYTNGVDTACGAGTNNSARTASARRENAVATEDPGAFSLPETEGWVCNTVAVQPAGGGGGGGTSGSAWIEGTDLHWIDANDTEQNVTGTDTGNDPAGAVAGSCWIDGSDLHYIDASGNERTITGTDAGNDPAGAVSGSAWIEGANLHYIDATGNERTIS